MTQAKAPKRSLDYYSVTRDEIAPLIPSEAKRILEIGCGAGATLNWLRQSLPNAWLGGVDINAAQLSGTSAFVDYSEVCNIEEGLPSVEQGSIDLLLCLDVLEHLRDPWSTL